MSDDRHSRRQFLGAAAAVAALGASTSTAAAETTERGSVVDGPTRRYADYEYGEGAVTEKGAGSFDLSVWMEGISLSVNRCSDAVELTVSLPSGQLLVDLSAEESAVLREELRRAEAGVVAPEEGQ